MDQANTLQQDPIIKLELPLSQVNVLLQGVSSLPWNQANSVIGNVHSQVAPQLNPEPVAPPAAPAPAVIEAVPAASV